MIHLVAIECSTAAASVALLRGEDVVDHRFAADSRQSEHVLQAVDRLLRESDVAPQAVDAIAVAIGPGAFTGVRLAIAAAQGLALAWNVPVIPVSTLAALAFSVDQAAEPAVPVLAVLDARMGEIYAGWFRSHRGTTEPLGAEQVLAAADLDRPAGVGDYIAVGAGFGVYQATIADVLGAPVRSFADAVPQARDVARLARRMWPDHAMPAESVEAAYLRNKVALTTAEREAGKQVSTGVSESL